MHHSLSYHHWRHLIASLLIAYLAPLATAQEPPRGYQGNPPIESLARFPQAQLGIETADGHVDFQIWLADTPLRQQQGLMFVRELASDQGMLFVNDPPRAASFWMKNTYIPLDMIFIGENGRILTIASDTVPHSLATISSGKPAIGVLEINAGISKKLGLAPGQAVLQRVLPSAAKAPASGTD